MQIGIEKRELIKKLQAKINTMQGFGKASGMERIQGLDPFAMAFPGKQFPTGAVHEFISYEPVDAAATSGFITSLISRFMNDGGICLWIGNQRMVFPAGLKHFGLSPDRIVFIDATRQKDLLWIIEEALKCEALTAVIGEIKELGFTESRRLQLAVEQSGVTGFIHRYQPYAEHASACVARWKITSLPSVLTDDLPGVGYSCWDVHLLKVRNGRPVSWQVSWHNNAFHTIEKPTEKIVLHERYAG